MSLPVSSGFVKYTRLSPYQRSPDVSISSAIASTDSSELKFAVSSTSNFTVTAQQPFQIQFNCTLVNRTICSYASKSIVSASTRIAASLKIYKQIVVQISLYSFCGSWLDTVSPCPRKGLVGQASPASFIPAKLNSD
ncbi:hypothetical protein HK096_000573, partial [Nowakowskiella sp. JEL0078]